MWSKLNEFKGKLTWSLLGNIVFALSQWIILSILARFGSAADLGIYSLGLAITAPVIQFFNFELRTVLATDSKNDYSFQQFFGSRIIHLLIAYLVIMPISFFYVENTIATLSILLIGLIKIFEALSDLCMGYFQKESKIELIGKSQLYRGILSMTVSSLIYLITQSINFMLLGLLTVMILRFLFYDLKHLIPYTNVFPIFDLSGLKMIILFFPLGITALISSLVPNIPRYFLDYYVGVEAVGIYSALYYIIVAGNMLITPVSLLAAPRIANSYHNSTRSDFLKLISVLIILAVIMSLILILPVLLSGEYILTLLYGKGFAVYERAFIIISITLIFGFINSFLNLSIISTREVRSLPVLNGIAVCVSFIAGYLLIKDFAIEGAAWALLLSRLIQTLLYTVLFFNILRKIKTN
ncbi:hypothetical protein SLU01_01260 [Sporosarcina luteola]|uniref:Polysaccharide biosynthesis protein n=1 Tax=Sporosarcina luteola TaxID=582850 RepID=A0A511Z2X6_9BACL|nr:hypothetical protein [Sporosarcina luteola]GEN81814.1 hypothetical protein SLU01_01260 [Sporosarcina luteola]